MPGISISTTHRIIPMVYAYSTPEIARHDGHLKIGYTDRQSVEDRVHQQGKRAPQWGRQLLMGHETVENDLVLDA